MTCHWYPTTRGPAIRLRRSRGQPELVRIPAARQDICWTVAVQVAGSDHGVEES